MLLPIKICLLSCALIISTTEALLNGPSPLGAVTGALSGAANPLSAVTGAAGGAGSPLGAATGVLGTATGALGGAGNPLSSASGVLGTATGALGGAASPLGAVTGLASSLPVVGGLTGGGAPPPAPVAGAGAAPAPVPGPAPVPAAGVPPAATVPAIAPALPPAAAGSSSNELATFSQLLKNFSDAIGNLLSTIIGALASRIPSQTPTAQGQPAGQLPPITGMLKSDSEEDILTVELKKLREDIKLLSNSQNKQCLYFGMCIAKDISKELLYGAKRRGYYFKSLVQEKLGTFLNYYEGNEIMSSSPDTNCVLNYQNSCPLVQNIRWYNPSL